MLSVFSCNSLRFLASFAMSNILLSDLFFNFSGNVLVALAVTFVIACALGFRNKKVFSAVVIGRDGDPSLPKIVEDTYTKVGILSVVKNSV